MQETPACPTESRANADALSWRVRSRPCGFRLLASFVAFVALGAPAAASPPPLRFDPAIAAILARRCVRCHGPTKAEENLRLDSYAAVLRGGTRGPIIIPGAPGESLLLAKVLHRDAPAMPPRQHIPPREIAALRTWITQGALP